MNSSAMMRRTPCRVSSATLTRQAVRRIIADEFMRPFYESRAERVA